LDTLLARKETVSRTSDKPGKYPFAVSLFWGLIDPVKPVEGRTRNNANSKFRHSLSSTRNRVARRCRVFAFCECRPLLSCRKVRQEDSFNRLIRAAPAGNDPAPQRRIEKRADNHGRLAYPDLLKEQPLERLRNATSCPRKGYRLPTGIGEPRDVKTAYARLKNATVNQFAARSFSGVRCRAAELKTRATNLSDPTL